MGGRERETDSRAIFWISPVMGMAVDFNKNYSLFSFQAWHIKGKHACYQTAFLYNLSNFHKTSCLWVSLPMRL